QSVKYQSLVEDRLRHTDIAFSLCEDLYTSVQNCIELAQQIQQAGLQERSLLAGVLQADTQTAVLATDVWCFLARYGTAELCFHHVLLIAHLIRSCPGEGYQMFNLALLLRRLLFLMTPKHQVEFVERFPPAQEENQCVWHHTLLRSLCTEARMRVEDDVLAGASVVLQELENSGYRMGDILRLVREIKRQ
ncbi:hypothetical protein cypCar_00009516, partial [Cyprinus carpio]